MVSKEQTNSREGGQKVRDYRSGSRCCRRTHSSIIRKGLQYGLPVIKSSKCGMKYEHNNQRNGSNPSLDVCLSLGCDGPVLLIRRFLLCCLVVDVGEAPPINPNEEAT